MAKFVGVWQEKTSPWIYRIYAIVFHFFGTFLFTFFGFLYLFHMEDILGLSDCLSIFLTMIAFCIKAINFMLNRTKFLNLIQSLNILIQRSAFQGNKGHKRIRVHIKKLAIIFNLFAVATVFAVVTSILVPIFNWRKHVLPYRMYFPRVDYKNNDYMFAILVLFQSTPALTSVLDITLDTLPVVYMGFAVGLLEELSVRLENIGSIIEGNNSEEASNPVVKSGRQINKLDPMEELLKCIEIHKEIKKYIGDIQKYFATIIMTQGIMSSLILCTTVFTISVVISLFTLYI